MAELIEKRTIRKIIEKYFESLAPSHYYKMDLEKASVYLDAEIAELPTTTEAEIKAKAIDEFADKLKTEYIHYDIDDALEHSIYTSYSENILALEEYVDKLAEQLKEE